MMSQIDGLVNNLNADIGKISAGKLKADVDKKENMLKAEDMSMMTSMQDMTVRPSNVDESVLQKRPSNNDGSKAQQQQQRQSMNIFNKERPTQ